MRKFLPWNLKLRYTQSIWSYPSFRGVRYTPTIIQLGRAHIMFGVGHHQALKSYGLLQTTARSSFGNPKLQSNFYVIYEMD